MHAAKSNLGASAKYRADIDGLRAIAVLIVILYHAGVQQFSGGFVGVDVFFVISGYLITQYIDQRIKDRKFSLLEFYERRVRRILPALFFLLLAATVAAFLILLPQDLVKFAKSEIATVCFMPNLFFFYWGSGYFETGTKLKPLLHMWSLGVEEQFYILFPLLMVLLARCGKRTKVVSVWLMFAISFALSLWAVQVRGLRDEGFYLAPFRAWELLLGALLTLGTVPLRTSSVVRNILAAGGFVAILLSATAYSSNTPFPGLSAALPCLGTALIIYANETGSTLTGNVLSLRPFVFVGVISYSLYLWHWPVIVYAKHLIGRPLNAPEKIAAVLISMIAAVFSWRFVERPYRGAASSVRRNALLLRAAIAGGGLLALSSICVGVRGLPQRFPQQAITYADAGSDWGTEQDVCRTSKQIEVRVQCHFGSETHATPDFILWGDSHAASLAPAFEVLANTSGNSGWIASFPACLPLPGVHRVGTPGCPEFNDAVSSLIERANIRRIVLAGRWAIPALGLSEGELEDGRAQVLLFDSSSRVRSLPENEQVLGRALRRLVSHLTAENRQVILVMDVPDTGVNTPGYLARSVIDGKLADTRQDTRLAMSEYTRESARADQLLARLALEFHAVAVDPKSLLCEESECLIARDGHSLYHDSNHLTRFGALQLVDLFRPLLPQAASANTTIAERRFAMP